MSAAPLVISDIPELDDETVEDLEEAPADELDAAEEEILDQATAARSMGELKAEIETLKRLEASALGLDWRNPSRLWVYVF